MKSPMDVSTLSIPGLGIASSTGELPWKRTSVPGVVWLPLALAGSSRGARRGGGAVLIRMDPGCGYPAHRHVGVEHVLVLQGGYADAWGEHRQGDFVHYPAGTAHAPVALGDATRPAGSSNPACVLYTTLEEGIDLLEEPAGPSTDACPP